MEASGSPYAVGANPLQIAAADFNGDGKLDLAVVLGAITNTGSVAILLQQ
jgi:FG-GAP repeat